MQNVCYSSNINELKEKLSGCKTSKIDNTLCHKKLNNLIDNNISNNFIANNSSIPKIMNRNLGLKNENMSLNNIIPFNPFIQKNFELTPIIKKKFRKINITKLPNPKKYSNAILFKKRDIKQIKYSSRNSSELNKYNIKLGNNINSFENDILNNKRNILMTKREIDFNRNYFLTPTKRRINSKIYESLSSINRSINYLKNNHKSALPSKKNERNPGIILPRVNSAIYLPKMNSLNPKKNSSLLLSKDLEKEKEKEIEKIVINQNLKKLLYRIKKKMLPEKRVVLSSYKLPSLKMMRNKKDIINSCIHRVEYGDTIVLVKTHLDGFDEEQKRKEIKKAKTTRKYEINEGYVDLNVLNSGNNISFKTNLIEKDGLYYYEFNKYGRMETVEEKVHKIKKDRKEFRKLMERYNKNESFKMIENQEFEANVKKNYGAEPIVNQNIYRDLFHMLFKK